MIGDKQAIIQHFRLNYKNEENKSKIDVLVIVSLLLISLYIKSLGFFIVYSEQQILLDYLIFVLLISAYFFTKTLLIKLFEFNMQLEPILVLALIIASCITIVPSFIVENLDT